MFCFFCQTHKEEERIQSAANSIAEHAYKLSLDPDYMSPFALSACDFGIDLCGEIYFFNYKQTTYVIHLFDVKGVYIENLIYLT